MKTKRGKMGVWLLAAFLLTGLAGCQVQRTQEPGLAISREGEPVRVMPYGDRYHDRQEDIENRVQSFMVGKEFSELPAIQVGDELLIEALNFEADSLAVYDYLMDEGGRMVSDFKAPAVASFSGGDASWTFSHGDTHPHSLQRDSGAVHLILIKVRIAEDDFVFAALLRQPLE
ncbi:MAG: hypothetical protein AVO33_00095 [delta proteobacterium ML8_F1]|nr:MAG: hypothetical protein AVO33_00095 [delta proteobacterium ML8_F1]